MPPFTPTPIPVWEWAKESEYIRAVMRRSECMARVDNVCQSAAQGDIGMMCELMDMLANRDYSKPLPEMKRTGPLD